MKICLVGLNHKTAPVHVRETVSILSHEISSALQVIREQPGVLDGCLVSTCNRLELVVLLNEDTDPQTVFLQFLSELRQIDPSQLAGHLYVHTEREAVRHLFRVASSLDSMVLGESQILGQVKDAMHQALAAGLLNTYLKSLFDKAFTAAKRVRSETEIASSAVSISYAAVELARKIFGELQEKKVLILGAGKMSELTAMHLLNSGVRGVVVSNRTYGKAEELARKLRGEAASFDDIERHLGTADIVISSTRAPHYILKREQIAAAVRQRRNRPLFLIDIAVPRDIDPEVNSLSNVFLYNIDDLANVVDMNLKMREKAAQQATRIVDQEVEGFLRSLEVRDLGPEIADLRQTLEKICQEELVKARTRLGTLTTDQSKALDLMVHRIVSKISHPLIMEMKNTPKEVSSLRHRLVQLFHSATTG
ncbi:MAG: glutamyl-tRNA reductase [Acidobacteriota bacterium]